MSSKDLKLKNVMVTADDDNNSNKEDDLGNVLEKLTLGPKKKLLVIPLGGFILHRVHLRDKAKRPKTRPSDFSHRNFLIYKRPFCREFLKFCFERFQVGLWSSALEHNIDVVLTQVMGDLKSKLLFILDQEHCTETRFMSLENKNKPVLLKELKHLWANKYKRLSYRAGEYSSSNTLLIDTNSYKGLLNPPNSGIFLKSYDPDNKSDDLLGPNSKLRTFLDGLAEAKDVQSYVKDHPIGEAAITSSHPDWDYYSKIIQAYDGKESDTDDDDDYEDED